jgi:hypothetical protein
MIWKFQKPEGMMIKSRLTKPQKKSGYAKKPRRVEKAAAPAQAAPTVVPKKPLLPGIDKALMAMSALSNQLKSRQNGDYVVSIEPLDDQWALVVRGPNPHINYFSIYPVMWVKSNYVRNPRAILTR